MDDDQQQKRPGAIPGQAGLKWDFDLTLPILAALIIVLGWFMVVNYERALREGATKAFETTQLEIVRAAARSAEVYAASRLGEKHPPAEVEREILKLFIAPIRLLENGDAWMYAPDHVIYDESSDFPQEYRGKSMAEIFASQSKRGASHFGVMAADVAAGREGVGWYVWLPEKGPEIAAWTPMRIGDAVWTIGLSTPLSEILIATGVEEQSRNAIGMMAFITIGGLGLAFTSTRNIIRRRRAEVELAEANKDLEARVERGAKELAAKTRALIEAHLREKIQEKEAQIAYASGLIESAGEYLHHFGNSLTSLETLILKDAKVLASMDQYAKALETIRLAHQAALETPGLEDQTLEFLDLFEEALTRRALPRLKDNAAAMMELKNRMIASIDNQRQDFERMRPKDYYVRGLFLAKILANMAEERRQPGETAHVAVKTELAPDVTVNARKHPLIHGLGALIDICAAAARKGRAGTPEVLIRLENAAEAPYKARITISDNGGAEDGLSRPLTGNGDGPVGRAVYGFMNFVNENNGKLQTPAKEEGMAARFVILLGDAPEIGADDSATPEPAPAIETGTLSVNRIGPNGPESPDGRGGGEGLS